MLQIERGIWQAGISLEKSDQVNTRSENQRVRDPRRNAGCVRWGESVKETQDGFPQVLRSHCAQEGMNLFCPSGVWLGSAGQLCLPCLEAHPGLRVGGLQKGVSSQHSQACWHWPPAGCHTRWRLPLRKTNQASSQTTALQEGMSGSSWAFTTFCSPNKASHFAGLHWRDGKKRVSTSWWKRVKENVATLTLSQFLKVAWEKGELHREMDETKAYSFHTRIYLTLKILQLKSPNLIPNH